MKKLITFLMLGLMFVSFSGSDCDKGKTDVATPKIPEAPPEKKDTIEYKPTPKDHEWQPPLNNGISPPPEKKIDPTEEPPE